MSRTLLVSLSVLVALGTLSGCKKDDPPNKLIETGWFRDTGLFDAGRCKQRVGGFLPGNGDDDWYHRDSPGFYVDKADTEAYTASLISADGVPAAFTPVWSPEELIFTFQLSQPLKADTEYVMTVTDCAETHESTFRTSRFGLPMSVSPAELVGRTYLLDMLGANWREPGGAEALIQLYFSSPALLGVPYADSQRIDLLGAPGEVDPFGGLHQGPGSTWDFPTAGFEDAPYFESNATLVVFQFEGVEIPIFNARLAATFSADGTRIGGGELSGLGDTRDLGQFLGGGGGNDPGAICDLAFSLGIECEDCPDGEPYCMFLDAVSLEGSLVHDLSLVPRN